MLKPLVDYPRFGTPIINAARKSREKQKANADVEARGELFANQLKANVEDILGRGEVEREKNALMTNAPSPSAPWTVTSSSCASCLARSGSARASIA